MPTPESLTRNLLEGAPSECYERTLELVLKAHVQVDIDWGSKNLTFGSQMLSPAGFSTKIAQRGYLKPYVNPEPETLNPKP